MKEIWRDNPMMAEARRVNANLLRTAKWTPAHTGAAVVGGSFYLLLLGFIIRYSDSFPGIILMYLLLTALTLVIPVSLHGVLAGEREKRSLDMLLAAPVSSAQIVVAKASRVIGMVLVVNALLAGPAVVLLIAQALSSRPVAFIDSGVGHYSSWFMLIVSLLLISAASFMFTGVSVFLSSLAKNAGSALLSCIGVNIGALLVAPLLVSLFVSIFGPGIGPSSSFSTPLMLFYGLHPFVGLVSYSITPGPGGPGPEFAFLSVTLNVVVWTAVGLLGLFLAAERLDYERQS